MASVLTHHLPLKLGLTLWSDCQRGTSFRGIWTARSGFSNSPGSYNRQYCSAQILGSPRQLHCNAQPLTDIKITPPLSQILLHGTRRLHSEVSKDSTSLTPSNQSSSDESQKNWRTTDTCYFCLNLIISIYVVYLEDQRRSAQRLTAHIPGGRIFAERMKLRKEEEDIKTETSKMSPSGSGEPHIQHRKKKLKEKTEALDKEELELLRQRARVLEGKLESREASIENEMTN